MNVVFCSVEDDSLKYVTFDRHLDRGLSQKLEITMRSVIYAQCKNLATNAGNLSPLGEYCYHYFWSNFKSMCL